MAYETKASPANVSPSSHLYRLSFRFHYHIGAQIVFLEFKGRGAWKFSFMAFSSHAGTIFKDNNGLFLVQVRGVLEARTLTRGL